MELAKNILDEHSELSKKTRELIAAWPRTKERSTTRRTRSYSTNSRRQEVGAQTEDNMNEDKDEHKDEEEDLTEILHG